MSKKHSVVGTISTGIDGKATPWCLEGPEIRGCLCAGFGYVGGSDSEGILWCCGANVSGSKDDDVSPWCWGSYTSSVIDHEVTTCCW